MKLQLQGKELRAIGFPEGPVISVAMNTMQREFKYHSVEAVLEILKEVLAKPEAFRGDPKVGKIADLLIPKPDEKGEGVSLQSEAVPFHVYGQEFIDEGAMHQMFTAAKLPVAVAGALMPDAHHGYGLPIGGVLATENAVIPYGVGVDIGCRMCLSIFDMQPVELQRRLSFFEKELSAATLFGSGGQFTETVDHEVLDDSLFNELPLLKSLHGRAWKQLGTSGSGNHFVEFGEVLINGDEVAGVEPGRYIGLLSHSGSRGLGATIASHYTKLAINKRRLPADAKNLAWFTLDEEEGMEYWLSMNLAGAYASACHHVIHRKIAKAMGQDAIAMVENHHNFAWKEKWEGRDVIVHRKGATPAGAGVLGIIPGSMTADGFIVRGRGVALSLNSASHGAGRKLSRTKAMESITSEQLQAELERSGVRLIGGGLDESPFAYKNIYEVMEAQVDLVDVVGKFTPRIVRMDGSPHKSWKKKS